MTKSKKNRKKVLIIDDDPTLLKLMVASFEEEGYKVVSGKTGQDAVKLTDKEHPAAIVLDLEMPKMDGLEALKKIRENENNQEVPIIIATNNSSSEAVFECLQNGASDYFIKSEISVDKLVENVKEKIG